ncbi:MAG TPA: hypothetical protein VJN92_13465 [Candidatus Acidoferrum sp.]|nr:hypothetical protein [Candidatus Acidoferrum sp.]
MIRKASTAALGDSSELLFLRQTRTAPPGWRSKTQGQKEVSVICRFVLWGTFIL